MSKSLRYNKTPTALMFAAINIFLIVMSFYAFISYPISYVMGLAIGIAYLVCLKYKLRFAKPNAPALQNSIKDYLVFISGIVLLVYSLGVILFSHRRDQAQGFQYIINSPWIANVVGLLLPVFIALLVLTITKRGNSAS